MQNFIKLYQCYTSAKKILFLIMKERRLEKKNTSWLLAVSHKKLLQINLAQIQLEDLCVCGHKVSMNSFEQSILLGMWALGQVSDS
jgi:hypothetical protein